MDTRLIALTLANEYLTLVENKLESYAKILDELDDKITNEPSRHKKQILEEKRTLLAKEASQMYEIARDKTTVQMYIYKRLGGL